MHLDQKSLNTDLFTALKSPALKWSLQIVPYESYRVLTCVRICNCQIELYSLSNDILSFLSVFAALVHFGMSLSFWIDSVPNCSEVM